MRIISGPSVAIVNATPCSMNAPNVSRTASSSGSAFVSRFEVGQISSTVPASRRSRISSGSLGGEDAVADPVRAQALDHLAQLLAAGLAPSSPTWIVIPSPAARAVSTIGATCV